MNNKIALGLSALLIGVVVLGGSLLIADLLLVRETTHTGRVLGLQYKGDDSSIGIISGQSSDGTGTGVILSGSDEAFIVHIAGDNGESVSAECDAALWYDLEAGDRVLYAERRGRIIGVFSEYRVAGLEPYEVLH